MLSSSRPLESLSILPPDQRPPEPPEPPPHCEDLDYRQTHFPSSGFGDGYRSHMMSGEMASHTLREVSCSVHKQEAAAAAAGTTGPQDCLSAGGTGAATAGSGGGGGGNNPNSMVFSGDKDHRFEYSNSPMPVEGSSSRHLYNHTIAGKDVAPLYPPPPASTSHPGQAWGSPSQSVAPHLPHGFTPHMSTASLRGRGGPPF